MKHWYFIEDCTSSRSEVYDEILTAGTVTEAFIEAAGKWDALTEADRNRRDDAYIGYADTDEDGCVDYDTMTGIYYLRREKETVYYLLDDQNGYGSEYPFCSDAVETARLLENWNYSGTDDPLPDCWHEADCSKIEELGTYDGTTGTSHPGTRETESEES